MQSTAAVPFTPKPWRKSNITGVIKVSAAGRLFAICTLWKEGDYEEMEANGRLIEKSPDLFEILEGLRSAGSMEAVERERLFDRAEKELNYIRYGEEVQHAQAQQ